MNKIRAMILIAAASVACGLKYDGLRVKFGWSEALADIDYFFKIPRTIAEAEENSWFRSPREDNKTNVRMYCLPGRYVCPLYDVTGFIAGLRIAFPDKDFRSTQSRKSHSKLMEWDLPKSQLLELELRSYWYVEQYYVSEDSLAAGDGPSVENGATLQEGAVWVSGEKGKLLKIPTSEAALKNALFSKQNCIPNMGTHYYYNVTEIFDCDYHVPWHALVSEGQLVGTGFQIFGSLSTHRYREWFDSSDESKELIKYSMPNASGCQTLLSRLYGSVNIHIYYVDKPWNIRCKDKDSVMPPNAFYKLKLTTKRYLAMLLDPIKRIFRG